ncbi:MAG: hypothetical protein II954_10660 [Synergistaceae bacterium]|nr:hypothetical protein [Synergistaceae bacterium]
MGEVWVSGVSEGNISVGECESVSSYVGEVWVSGVSETISPPEIVRGCAGI